MCCIMGQQEGGSDPVKYFTRAFEHYSKVQGRSGRMLATRALLLCSAYQAAMGRCASVTLGHTTETTELHYTKQALMHASSACL